MKIRAGQHGDELLTAESGREIHAARCAGEHVGEPLESFVARLVSVGIVVALEVVEIEEDDAQ